VMAAAVAVEIGGRLATWCPEVAIALCWKCLVVETRQRFGLPVVDLGCLVTSVAPRHMQ
jgi:hypothetical protein